MLVSSRWNDLRARGGLWVVAQFALMAAIVAAWFVPPRWPGSLRLPFSVAGAVLATVGLVLVFWSRRSLGDAFTPFPQPRPGGKRVEAGPYRLVRHPMYGGAILLFAGISLFISVAALVLSGVLALFWRAKSEAEERALAARYPEYDAYRRRTPQRFLPRIY
jgi:protein-S-isoprenylcysteine O-methyltransferase Ste14